MFWSERVYKRCSYPPMNHCERNKTSVTTEGFTGYSVNGDIQ